MDSAELLAIIKRGESSKVQFKERLPHPDSFADETEIYNSSVSDLDARFFSEYFKYEGNDIKSCIKYLQGGQGFNLHGNSEISLVSLMVTQLYETTK